MTRTENDQEFVLGNKQLLSAFFVVVALLGVFFTMGYIIGRNTNAPAEGKGATRAESPAAVPDTAPSSKPAETASSAPAEAAPIETKPAAKAPEDAPAETPKRTAREPGDAAPSLPHSASGHSYLQVMAVKRPVADNTVRILKERGFPALLGESSKPELFRVMVGPYADTAGLAKAKSDLKAMGFDSVVAK
jgi:cell division protein FtsN